jgi:hypothetical protein
MLSSEMKAELSIEHTHRILDHRDIVNGQCARPQFDKAGPLASTVNTEARTEAGLPEITMASRNGDVHVSCSA